MHRKNLFNPGQTLSLLRIVVQIFLFFADSWDQLTSYGSLFQSLRADFYFYDYYVFGDYLDPIGIIGGR